MKKIVQIKKSYMILFFILISSGYIICHYFSAIETFKPEFPREYDTLIVDHYDSRLIIKRNEKVDEFISKSSRVSEHIGEGRNMYILRFFLDGKQVYYIPYDDIGYPSAAVKIMRELMKENTEVPNIK